MAFIEFDVERLKDINYDESAILLNFKDNHEKEVYRRFISFMNLETFTTISKHYDKHFMYQCRVCLSCRRGYFSIDGPYGHGRKSSWYYFEDLALSDYGKIRCADRSCGNIADLDHECSWFKKKFNKKPLPNAFVVGKDLNLKDTYFAHHKKIDKDNKNEYTLEEVEDEIRNIKRPSKVYVDSRENIMKKHKYKKKKKNF